MAITSRTRHGVGDDATAAPEPTTDEDIILTIPGIDDGVAMWQLARDSKVLDLNTSYAYLLWCRDFSSTSIVAYAGDQPAGFVSGYLRPDEPGTLMVWQVAVSERQRGRGLASRMLGELADRVRPRCLETTISPDNEPSMRLFTGFARERSADVKRTVLFDVDSFPPGEAHEPEVLFRIAPLS